ncbi:MAG: NAD-dependent succinate-semialdehyde dehydrogenase [Lewinellaceae bacterium]|nr:NAD-dependent succinate-semialdehyde dehydrogenase [Lewinellaceae bacterium]
MSFLKDSTLFRQNAYINGKWESADSGKSFPVTNPATGDILAQVSDCAIPETQRAIAAAEAALPDWRAKTAAQRGALLQRWNDLIIENVEDLALLMTLEQGKPLTESRGEVRYGASFIEWFAEEGRRVYGDIIPPHAPNLRVLVFKEPVGVVAAITPWNFPNAMITRKVAPALAAGCTVVVKPSEETPLSALALAELAERAGFPPGVLNIVTGLDAPTIGQELTKSRVVRKLSFTGSTVVGKLLMRQCADTVKKISLELGGNAPFIVFDDADLDAAVEGAIAAKYRNAGQTCVCANRLYVQSGIYDRFVEKFTEAVQKQKVGIGTEHGVSIGPLINVRALEKVERLLADAVQKGAQVRTGGHALQGTFYEPTVVTGIQTGMDILQEEIFGPIAPIARFDTEKEVVEYANNTQYGLAAYFYGRDVGRIFRVADALEYGMVGVNTGILGTAIAPFGGMKQSGIGREGSKYGIEEFLEIKYVCVAGL